MSYALSQTALMLMTVLGAYVVFGMAGFGSALVAGPLLAHIIPVPFVIPILALLDFTAAATSGVKLGGKIARKEIYAMVPMMMLGNAIGITLLMKLPADFMMLLLGIFIVVYACYSLWGVRQITLPSRRWAIPFGMAAGVLGSMFGSGGIAYTIYLCGRLQDKDEIRATMATLIGINTFARAAMFLVAGVYFNRSLILTALLLFPGVLVGLYMGHRMTLALSKEQFFRIINILLVLSGASLIWRYVAGA